MSVRLRVLNTYLRNIEKPILGRINDPLSARSRFEVQARGFMNPPFALYLDDRLGDVLATWASCRVKKPGIILYFHGGGYVMGSPATHRAMLARLSALTSMNCCLPDYRLAPEHPHPAALDDAWTCWKTLLVRGYTADQIILGGDSAGGGLMLNLLARICQSGEKRPLAAFAFSPWTDLTMSGASLVGNAGSEAVLPANSIKQACGYVVGSHNSAHISPLFANFPDCPPVFLQASQTEALRDDTLRMETALENQGADVTLDMWEDTPHVWTLFQGWLPEADVALKRVAAFITQKLALPPLDEN